VIDGVTNEMQERFAEPVENRTIEFEFRTHDLDFDTLSQFFGDLTGGPGKIVGHTNQGGRAKFEDPSLKLRNPPVHPIKTVGHIRILRIACDPGPKLTRTENDLAHCGQESIQGLCSYTDRRTQSRCRRRSSPLRRNGGNRLRRIAHRRVSSGL